MSPADGFEQFWQAILRPMAVASRLDTFTAKNLAEMAWRESHQRALRGTQEGERVEP